VIPVQRNLSIVVVAVVVALGVRAFPAWAHHAFAAEFDINSPVKLRGVLTKMEWVNPHAWLHLDVKEEDGKTVAWMIETAAPNALLRRGYTKNSLPVGTEILVEGFRARDRSNKANGATITFADGKTLFVGGETR
jgi:Family of unknown function (DUF6152)